ncbi:phage portal protein [Nocardia ignorata]|uniref:A118 family predicted phage portal protein n=1 Tax=Nocardia ignorata TaxID=145285 RepID=A0A4R6P3A3_NOCIG|nr:phage portal protein [Nocardia ignorata]TDP29771.1 A118 family predicted phage portal protein [Nocardia ignorata]
MPLPEFAGQFPPKPWDTAQEGYATHSAWWEGNPEALEEIYRHTALAPTPRASQLRGGIVGRLARFWWGRPVMQDTKRLHIPAPADVATTSADLLFGQPPSWLFNDGDATNLEAAQDRLNQLLDGADVVATFLEAAEIQAALGGVFLRLWWDQDATDKVMIGAVAPDCAIPQWRYGELAAVTFWTIVGKDKRGTWRHLEHHEPGRIEHALFCGDDSDIGRRMPLAEMDATAWAAELVDEESSIATGVTGLTACYIPNVRPARRWRNVPTLSPLGRSDFEGVEHLFDALDEAWSSWMRDLDLAKGRLFVSNELLDDHGPGRGASFDRERDIFTGVPADTMDEQTRPLVQAEQFEIRVEEHAKTCEKLLKQILRACGYSAADFDDGEAVAITATEVSARKDKSNQTRNRKILYWQSAVQPLARTMLELDRIIYPGTSFELLAEPEMKFPVRVDQDPVQLSTAIANMRAAQVMSRETAVRERHPNWSNDEVADEVQRLADEFDVLVPDHTGDFGPAIDSEDAHSDLQQDNPAPTKKPDDDAEV